MPLKGSHFDVFPIKPLKKTYDEAVKKRCVVYKCMVPLNVPMLQAVQKPYIALRHPLEGPMEIDVGFNEPSMAVYSL